MISNGVILAENDALMRGIVRAVLLRAEQQVFPVGNGAEAVTLAQQFRARLVLLDIAMPRLNGLLACQAIRALPDYADVPIVMLTGYDNEQFRLAAQRFGATDFILKPFQPNALLARLAPHLDLPAPARLAAAGDDALLGVHAQVWRGPEAPRTDHVQAEDRLLVWNTHAASGPARDERTHLLNGREVLRIQRNAERGS